MFIVLVRNSDDGSWTLRASASRQEAAKAPILTSGPASWDEATQDWDRPNADDFTEANKAAQRMNRPTVNAMTAAARAQREKAQRQRLHREKMKAYRQREKAYRKHLASQTAENKLVRRFISLQPMTQDEEAEAKRIIRLRTLRAPRPPKPPAKENSANLQK